MGSIAFARTWSSICVFVSLLLGGVTGRLAGGWIGGLLSNGSSIPRGATAGMLVGSVAAGMMISVALAVATEKGYGSAWRVIAVLLGGLVVGSTWGLVGGAVGILTLGKPLGSVLVTVAVSVLILFVLGMLAVLSGRRESL